MHILITGAAGFLGQRLIKALVARGELNGHTLTRLTLVDQVAPAVDHTIPPELAITTTSQDLSDPDAWDALLDERPDVIYHLAAVVSSAAEADLDLGMRVNFDATRSLLEGCRTHCLSQTRLIMASSVAVYGGQLPNVLDDMTALMPQSSYGTQKAMCELLINDYSRRGLVDGRVLRLPTVVIRPGRPNAAASSFASSILREPLNGEEAVCPVPTDLELFVMSPARVVECLVHGAEVDATELGACRALMLPGVTVTVADMLDTLQRKGGEEARSRVRHEPDEGVTSIVASWPGRFHTAKALRLGFRADDDFDAVVDAFLSEQAR